MELVKVENQKVVVSSLMIAEKFEKRHDDVLKAIRSLECSSQFSLLNFTESEYTNSRGKKYPCYAITEKGFMRLAMGFTGSKAAEWQEAFINAFEKMRDLLEKSRKDPLLNTKKHLQRYELNKVNIPKGYFCMLKEMITEVIMPLELDGLDLMESAMPDGSLGKGFCKFLDANGFDVKNLPTYKHTLKNKIVVNAKLYPYTCYHLFKEFIDVWIEGKGKQYFTDRTISLLQLKK